jgi:phosphoesterase RecJ-like protein
LPEFLEILPGKELVVDQSVSEINLNRFDVFFMLDSSTLDRVSAASLDLPATLKTVNIDHHITNPKFGQINLVPDGYPATAQILFELFNQLSLVITPEAAANLFMGIYTDTGGFRYRGTNSDTFAAAAALVKIYPDFPSLMFALMNNNEPEVLLYEKLLLDSLAVVGRVAIVGADYQRLKDNGILEKHRHESLSNKLISVKDWQVGVTMLELAPGTIKLSFRTRDEQKFDVAKIASALGGGGHKAAAGATISSSYLEARARVIKIINEVYPELG